MIHALMKLLNSKDRVTDEEIQELSIECYGETNKFNRLLESLIEREVVIIVEGFYTIKKD